MTSKLNQDEVTNVISLEEITTRKENLITGITSGLEDFIDGRCKHFKDDEELEAYLMSL
jgi:hypothetical protein